MVRRGEVWWVRLDPTVGHDIRKTRPCLVVSPDQLNRHGISVIVPLTSSDQWRFRVSTSVAGKPGAAAADQVRAIDHTRLGRRIGDADPKVLTAVLAILREMFED
ncbi:type II toxin-antitoxin system PemK/MazF family toxin [uncultured Brevundimonas sp.]|uniref:type II toxin-antitoxin system PemK/MazF family toxin n=1 Tax=uncultured Brevundimonas sp. TaxID=213418 RepID=UPI00260C2337|nr:type II toxin-antitoxin system PemK/MazF family toxin [uncultured Brevundimonas sp.]